MSIALFPFPKIALILTYLSMSDRTRKTIKLMKNKTVTIIPLISTDGAGKTSVAEELATNYGFAHYSIRNVLFTIYEQKFFKKPSKPSDITELANQLRFEFGPHILMKKVIDTIQSSNTKGFYVIESIRCPGELEYFYSLENEILVKPVGIDAPAETRYKRLQTRGDYKAPENFGEFEKTN